jgi:hypothetical protein
VAVKLMSGCLRRNTVAPSDGLTNAERRHQRRISRERAEARQRRRLELSHDVIAIAGALTAMAIIAVAFAVGPAIAAARGEGTAGTFTIGYEQCPRKMGCTWFGTFVSRSGQVRPSVSYDGSLPAGAQPGERIPALFPGGQDVVFPPHDSHYWVPAVLLMLVIGAAVGFGLWVSPIGEGRRRARLA